jgi:hypothetical protein
MKNIIKNKTRIILYSLVLVLTLITIRVSFALFENNASAVVNPNIGRWIITLNNELISSGYTQDIVIDDFIYEENEYVESGVIAPGGSAYVDLVLDATECDVAVRYDITFNLEDTNYEDNISFSINDTYDATIRTDENTYSGVISLDSIEDGETITLRVNVDWNDSQEYDESDTSLGLVEDQTISVPINIRLNQYFGEELIEYEG